MSLTSTRQNRRWRGIVCALTIFLLFAFPAASMSIFDTVQLSKRGYSDQAIIDLIEATDSAFVLKAEDLSKLKNLGVSEVVIRAMLGRAVTGTPTRDSEPEETHAEGAANETPQASHEHSGTAESDLQNDESIGRFSAQSVHEERGGGHVHFALDLEGLRFLVLRDEGDHSSIQSRGRVIAQRLGAAWGEARGDFRVRRSATKREIVFVTSSDDIESETIRIMTVSAGDARGYELRSGRIVTKDLLAQYWADLFSDFWAVDHGDRPMRLLAIHEGEALALLGESLTRLDRSERSMGSALDNVPSAARHHLQRLAEAVPLEYGETGGH